MTPTRPSNLPATLEPVWERVEDRLSAIAIDVQPSDVEDTAGRVAVCSEFVLSVLERQPDALLERLVDREALSVATAAARFDLADCDEVTAMRRLR